MSAERRTPPSPPCAGGGLCSAHCSAHAAAAESPLSSAAAEGLSLALRRKVEGCAWQLRTGSRIPHRDSCYFTSARNSPLLVQMPPARMARPEPARSASRTAETRSRYVRGSLLPVCGIALDLTLPLGVESVCRDSPPVKHSTRAAAAPFPQMRLADACLLGGALRVSCMVPRASSLPGRVAQCEQRTRRACS